MRTYVPGKSAGREICRRLRQSSIGVEKGRKRAKRLKILEKKSSDSSTGEKWILFLKVSTLFPKSCVFFSETPINHHSRLLGKAFMRIPPAALSQKVGVTIRT